MKDIICIYYMFFKITSQWLFERKVSKYTKCITSSIFWAFLGAGVAKITVKDSW